MKFLASSLSSVRVMAPVSTWAPRDSSAGVLISRYRIMTSGRHCMAVSPRGDTCWSIRSEEHTSELQSLMRISYAVFCLKKKKHKSQPINHRNTEKYTYQPQLIRTPVDDAV